MAKPGGEGSSPLTNSALFSTKYPSRFACRTAVQHNAATRANPPRKGRKEKEKYRPSPHACQSPMTSALGPLESRTGVLVEAATFAERVRDLDLDVPANPYGVDGKRRGTRPIGREDLR